MERQRPIMTIQAVRRMAICIPILLCVTLAASPAQKRASLLGGARGAVHEVDGTPLEGMGVQLISAKTAIRTTVYTNAEGKYEFPVLETGEYTLRVPLPREYQPYVKEGVRIEGPSQLADIALTRISNTEFVPATPETLSQLTGSEWMLNLPGSGEEKRVFTLTCGFGCHSYQQIFRNRFDQRSWALILRKMMARGGGSPLILAENPTPTSIDRAHQPQLRDEAMLSKWLSQVRGPESPDEPLYFLPRPKGASTKVIVTEYELPRELLAPHDVHGDSRGNIWYTAHRSPYAGVLDLRTGAVKEYRIPGKDADTPNVLPGTHRVWVDKNDIVWFSENWDHYLTALDAKNGQIIRRFKVEGGRDNGSAFSNFAMDDQGFVYDSRGDGVAKIDSKTGQVVQKWSYKEATGGKYSGEATYDSIVTPDGKFWSGGTARGGLILDTRTGKMTVMESEGPAYSVGARGGFDLQQNAWFGGRGGMLIRMDSETHKLSEWYSPVQYDTFYEALPDKNGEIWAGGLQSGRLMRFNPKNEQWTQYMMPEPYAHDRRTWIDNSTSPVTVWFVDHEGFLVRVQPLE
ncbi:MAG: carboxypeptidase regulatory-like domain-containing protein [Acidobacteriia bacterium]|nr:carboxypeptidase regulatory-like domain-containing protein [Terriglobia bacterium]